MRRQLLQLAALDSKLVALPDAVDASLTSLTEVVEVLRSYDKRLDFSAKRLDDIENRLQELETLKRKYGCELEDFSKVIEGLENSLQYWENLDLQEETIKNEIEEAKANYIPLAVQLTQQRRAAAHTLEHKMVESLGHMSMDRCRFVVSIESATIGESGQALKSEVRAPKQPQPEKPSTPTFFFAAHGSDRVEFLFSANLGENPRPLGRVASGGELSRLMLTLISTIMDSEKENEDSSPEIVVFDEIDVGIGGRAAESVGQRLQLLATKKQVLCVTHQPQIARFADHHFALSKSVEKDRTTTRIQELSFEEKVSELARMVGGDEEAEVTRKTARWMLRDSVRKGHSPRRRKTAEKSV